MPIRIQRQRTKGYRQPPNTRYCGRPGPFGNPYSVTSNSRLDAHIRNSAVEYFRIYAARKLKDNPAWLDELRQYDYLSCFCGLDQLCHVDVILELLKVRNDA